MDDGTETVEWLNSFVGRYWQNFEKELSQTLWATIDGVLETSMISGMVNSLLMLE